MKRKRSETLISRQYEKKSLLAETLIRMKTNTGAVIGLAILAVLILVMLITTIFVPYSKITAMNAEYRFATPSAEYPFGNDNLGRDLFLRVLYGSRYSLAVGFGAVAISFVVGTFLGAIATYYGGILDEIVMRASDVLAALPALLLGMVIVVVLGNSLTVLMIAVSVSAVPVFMRMARAAVISVKDQEFVEASHAIGMSNFRILFTQVLPNGLSPLIVLVSIRMGIAILDAASLSFIGFGIAQPAPEWGALVSAGRNFVTMAPHVAFFPGAFIMLTVFACTLLGDGLRDALDPKLKQ